MSVYVIAEAGVNHNGDLNRAKQLVDIAVEAKADAVKFQTFISENEISTFAEKADYQKQNTGTDGNQLEMVKKLELKFDEFKILQNYCDSKDIEFLSTPFDFESADFLLDELKLKTIKIPSGEITNAPFLLHISKFKRRMIISTGMATLADIQIALGVIAFGLTNKENILPSISNFEKAYMSEEGQRLLREYVTLLHCTTEYPAPVNSVNLKAISTMNATFNLPIGYSDHTEGLAISLAAVAMGAKIIEKHITYDKKAEGPDHLASIEPLELKELVKNIRQIEESLGNGVKIPSAIELKNRSVARKSLVAKREISKNEKFDVENLAIKRPGTGISPLYYWDVQQFSAPKSFEYDEEIALNDCNK